MERPRSLKDILSGLIFIGFGLAFGYAAAGYQIGTALRMGPGYFPLLLAFALGGIGVAIVAKGLVSAVEDGDMGILPWRAGILLTAALVFFGATVRGLGLAPALFITAFASALASRQNGLLGSFLIATALTVFCLMIFHSALGVPVPLVGPWVGGLLGPATPPPAG